MKHAHFWTIYPEEEWTVYRWTVNSWYYKDPDKWVDEVLEAGEEELADNELHVLIAKVSELTLNAIHAIWWL